MNNQRLLLSLLLVIALAETPTPVLASTDPDPEDVTLMQTPYQVGDVEGEAIDLRTLSVSWRTVDVVVPGNGGLDIVVSRSFGKVPPHAVGRSLLPTWMHDYPRIAISANPNGVLEGDISGAGACEEPGAHYFNPIQPPTGDPLPPISGTNYRAPIVLVLPGEDPQTLMLREASATQYPATAKYVTAENTYVECSADGRTFIATTADGKRYTFDIKATSEGDQAYGNFAGARLFNASRVEDVHGNWIEYSYHTPPDTSWKQLNAITASDGRLVEFFYENGTSGPLDRMTANGRTWYYDYDQNVQGNTYLSRVRMPEGLEWNYEHNGPADTANYGTISKVVLPTGATIDYVYNPATISDWAKLDTRTVSGSDIPTAVWTYTYSEINAYEDVIVSGPAGRTDYRFHRGYSNLNDLHIWSFPNNWVAGQLQRLVVRDTILGNALRTVEYEYAGLDPIGTDGVGNNPRVLPHQRRHVIASRVTTTDELTGSVFVQELSGFDAYANVGSRIETGTQSRTTNFTYVNNTTDWIIGLQDTETIVGIGTIDRDYFPNGLLSRLDEYGIVMDYEYHPTGDLWREKWTRGIDNYESVYTNYFRGTPRLESHPENTSREREVNATGTLRWEEDARGNRTSYQYDDLMRVRLITLPVDAARSVTWLSPTRVVVSQGTYRKETTLDGLGRIVLEEERDTSWAPSRSIYKSRSYDAAGRLSFEAYASEDPLESDGNSFEYDELDRMTRVVSTADGSARTYCYGDPCDTASDYGIGLINGQIETDERGYETAYEYQSFGDPDSRAVTKISQQVRHAGEPGGLKFIDTVMQRNNLGKITSVVQGGHPRSYSYDARQQLWWLAEPERRASQFTYDDVGNLWYEQPVGEPATYYRYDGLNRRTRIDYPAGTQDVTFEYDDDGNVLVVDNSLSRWTYTYDGQSRLKTETLAIDGQTFVFSYDYDTLGGLEKLTYPGGVVAGFAPDALGRPSTVGSYVTSVDYHPDGQLGSVSYGDGHVRTVSLTPRRFPDLLTVGNGSTTILSLDYDYDLVGNTIGIADSLNPSSNRVLGYDGTSRLTSASGAWGNSSYVYDDIGNILSKTLGGNSYTYTMDSVNRLASISGSQSLAFSYDYLGNVISNGVQTFDYNAASQLVAVPSIPGTSYVYDGNGRRVKAVRPAGTDYYVYSKGGLLLYSKDVPNDVSREYHYLGKMLVAKREFGAGVIDDADGDGIPDDIELQLGLDPADASDGGGDLDGDGASNAAEYLAGTRLDNADTDGDGMSDGYELRYGLDPFTDDSALDGDGDGLTNLQEFQLQTNPNNADTDNDGVPDGVDPNPLFNPALIPVITYLLTS